MLSAGPEHPGIAMPNTTPLPAPEYEASPAGSEAEETYQQGEESDDDNDGNDTPSSYSTGLQLVFTVTNARDAEVVLDTYQRTQGQLQQQQYNFLRDQQKCRQRHELALAHRETQGQIDQMRVKDKGEMDKMTKREEIRQAGMSKDEEIRRERRAEKSELHRAEMEDRAHQMDEHIQQKAKKATDVLKIKNDGAQMNHALRTQQLRAEAENLHHTIKLVTKVAMQVVALVFALFFIGRFLTLM